MSDRTKNKLAENVVSTLTVVIFRVKISIQVLEGNLLCQELIGNKYVAKNTIGDERMRKKIP